MLTHLKHFKHPFSNERLRWEKIDKYEIDDKQSSFKFSDRLSRENLWSMEYTRRVIEEYKKFMFLGVIDGPVTPSLEVDQCWHLHMLYTDDYWNNFCRDTLGKNFHHGPTKGGKKEDEKYEVLYEKTLSLYRDYFGEPPVDIWPSSKIRFRNVNFVTVDLVDHWIIPVGDIKALFKLLIKQILC